jgi:class 3 adenylate cyclase
VDDAEAAAEALGRGDLLAAYDLAHRPAEDPNVPSRLRFLEVLAIARMGNSEEALRLYHLYALAAREEIDNRALLARILKDRAFREPGDSRTELVREAYQAYREIWDSTGDSFPGINAATLALIAGDREAASVLADRVLTAIPDEPDNYYSAASRAEALLLLGRYEEVAPLLTAAVIKPGADLGARSTTLLQFERLGAAMGLSPDCLSRLLHPLKPPAVAMFCGHIFRADSKREAVLAEAIDAALEQENVGIGYGALAAGADILIAERLVRAGGELHILLPFAEDDFIEQSVRPAGEEWLPRYRAVREAAASISTATHAGYVDDPKQYAYGACVAMGLVQLRASHLRAERVQIAVWDGRSGEQAGTGIDVARWKANGGRTAVIDGRGLNRSRSRAQTGLTAAPRELRSLLFADFPKFSTISERHLPGFWSQVMRTAADVLDTFSDHVEFRNSWGDAIYAVFRDVSVAADAGLTLQGALRALDPSCIGFASPLQMRVSLHHGPIFVGHDPVTGRGSYYGTEVSRAARVEPMTPPGSVYVSEPFASMLTLDAASRFNVRYVGRLHLPKGFGQFPIYSVERAP